MSDIPPALGTSSRRPRPSVFACVLSAVLLFAAAIITVRTIRRARYQESANTAPPAEAISGTADRAARLHDIVGTFATGQEEGDRIMIIDANGHVLFHPVGPLAKSLAISDTYQLGRRGDHTCLLTATSGSIDAIDIDHLLFCGDTYERAK